MIYTSVLIEDEGGDAADDGLWTLERSWRDNLLFNIVRTDKTATDLLQLPPVSSDAHATDATHHLNTTVSGTGGVIGGGGVNEEEEEYVNFTVSVLGTSQVFGELAILDPNQLSPNAAVAFTAVELYVRILLTLLHTYTCMCTLPLRYIRMYISYEHMHISNTYTPLTHMYTLHFSPLYRPLTAKSSLSSIYV